jgi:hypothetical protein
MMRAALEQDFSPPMAAARVVVLRSSFHYPIHTTTMASLHFCAKSTIRAQNICSVFWMRSRDGQPNKQKQANLLDM